ncbi:subtilase-type protease inhibitor [Streptomyces sp. 15-116A]|uniref:subtilase-type protease inhibitor n=1 Tax=Streptomyces sp. 15-116A TaxID=2259035 RepID=UPI0021B1AA6D|nr:subtilase-type protease inhibitor [Streptomyces sp. 15-116A]MCT7356453.1 subtilase-type protease inhibitor [Streptomyces sp. 15-116A]
MTYISRNAVRGVLPALLALIVCTAPAQADARPGDARGTWLHVTVTPQESRGTAAAPRSALLRCDPPGGHARAADACADLAASDGRIDGIPRKDTFCPMLYAPVTAHARGQWRGRLVDYTETFPNRCVLEARTGAVFALDRR